MSPERFTYNLQKGFVVYMDSIKNLLIENPKGYPCAKIILSTDIDYKSLNLLPQVIEDIERTTKEVNPDIIPCIHLTHHSPYEVIIILYGMLPDILQICQTFYYAFGGWKALSDIKNSKHEEANSSKGNKNSRDVVNQEQITNIEFSIGAIHFKKETKSTVKKVEYYIN